MIVGGYSMKRTTRLVNPLFSTLSWSASSAQDPRGFFDAEWFIDPNIFLDAR